jgi:hypothetical protein
MDREKLMDKIQKCLRLAKSSEPAEAAAALRQAQKMMAANNITKGVNARTFHSLTYSPVTRHKGTRK